jgi:CRP/FNR family cyclic AMP-dependent transcriptional regulator
LPAFTSERLEYPSDDELFRQDDYGDAVYVIAEGEADILVDSPRKSRGADHQLQA